MGILDPGHVLAVIGNLLPFSGFIGDVREFELGGKQENANNRTPTCWK